jgi:hypothetical protein
MIAQRYFLLLLSEIHAFQGHFSRGGPGPRYCHVGWTDRESRSVQEWMEGVGGRCLFLSSLPEIHTFKVVRDIFGRGGSGARYSMSDGGSRRQKATSIDTLFVQLFESGYFKRQMMVVGALGCKFLVSLLTNSCFREMTGIIVGAR